jgi:hypothetical protein
VPPAGPPRRRPCRPPAARGSPAAASATSTAVRFSCGGAARREGVWARQRAGGARQRQLQWAGGAAAGQPGGQVCGPVQVKATAVQLQTHLAPPHG